MTLRGFLWFRALAALVGLTVAALGAARLMEAVVEPEKVVPLVAVGLGLMLVAIPWREADRTEAPLHHRIESSSAR